MGKRTGLKVKSGIAAGHEFINTKNHNRRLLGR